jgi:hypothetical protein
MVASNRFGLTPAAAYLYHMLSGQATEVGSGPVLRTEDWRYSKKQPRRG